MAPKGFLVGDELRLIENLSREDFLHKFGGLFSTLRHTEIIIESEYIWKQSTLPSGTKIGFTGWIAIQQMLNCSIWYSHHASMWCCSLSTLRSLRACCSNDTWECSARSWSCWLACISNAFPPPPVPPSPPRFPQCHQWQPRETSWLDSHSLVQHKYWCMQS